MQQMVCHAHEEAPEMWVAIQDHNLDHSDKNDDNISTGDGVVILSQ